MKALLIFAVLILTLAGGVLARGEGPDAQYIKIYNAIREADNLGQNGQARAAYERYMEALSGLNALRKSYPDWSERLMQFRINYVNEKLSQLPVPAAVASEPKTAAPESTAAPQAPKPDDKAALVEKPAGMIELENRVKTLAEENRRLNADKGVLEAKLREALSAQPATVDPRELVKAEARIRALEKEKEILQVTLKQDQARAAKVSDPAAVAEVKKQLAEANRKVEEQNKTISALRQEKEILESRVKSSGSKADLSRIKAENEALKQEVATLKSNRLSPPPPVRVVPDSAGDKKAARAEARQVKKLQEERDALQRKLTATEKSLAEAKARKSAQKADQLARELAALQAKISVYEARKIPYTAEELALFKAPSPVLSNPDEQPAAAPSAGPLIAEARRDNPASPNPPKDKPAKRSLKDLPAGASALVAEARRDFAAGRYQAAESKYEQVLKLDEKNVFTLGNLAAIQMEQNRLADAEKNLKQALTLEPEDAFNLSLWGIMKFRQEKYDDALDALSRSAKSDPSNAETQNYLGITFSQKGQRDAAESALRKSIQISPEYASAHHNLAIVYATQKPPFVALAKYHYQKALALGHPKNPDLEKLITSK